MKEISLIACVSKDRGLGKDQSLLWHFLADMGFFKRTTLGSTVVMGSKTFASIGKPLPRRHNLVLSRGEIPGYSRDQLTVLHSPAELESYLAKIDQPVFIIGGASLYQMFIHQANRLLLTEVDATKPADTFFPEFDRQLFNRQVLETHQQDGINFEIVEYTRKARS